MKVQILVGILFLLLNTFAFGQTRTGTGPTDGDLVRDFLTSLNEKSADCSREKTNFKTLSEFKLYYTFEESLEKKADPNCAENSIPKKYSCIFDKKIKKEFSNLLKHEKYLILVEDHGKLNNISKEEISSILIFLNDLDLKLNNEEKK